MLPAFINDCIVAFWRSNISPNASILAAVSGGCDSIALIHLLYRLKEILKIKKLAIVHVNYGLRGVESDGDEFLVQDTAINLGIPLYIKRLSGHSLHDAGIELWARQERYCFFDAIKEQYEFSYTATGHTIEDQAETVLFRMLRGSGIRGLRGILPAREDRVIRPLLRIHKQMLIEWLDSEKIKFRTDSSNSDIQYSRNYIRHRVLPMIRQYEPESVERIALLAEQMQNAWEMVCPGINKWIARYVIRQSGSTFFVKKEGLLDGPVAAEGLRLVFEENGISVSREHIESVFRFGQRSSGHFLLPDKWHYYPSRDKIIFTNKSGDVEDFYCILPIPGSTVCRDNGIGFTILEEDVHSLKDLECEKWTVLLDRESINGNSLIYRKIKFSDEFIPLGRNHKTSLLRFLSNLGFAKIYRENMGVITDAEDRVVWIPGVRLCQNNSVKKSTCKIIKIVSRILSNNI